MDQLHAILHKASRSVSLDAHAKDGFRRTLEALTDSPAVAPASFRLPRALAWALAALVAATTGATATYASTRAVPGDTLYAVKVNVVEPVETAFAFSADAKAQVAVAHLERRFQEAAVLSASGSLEAHDEELAARAAADVATVDRDDQPEARARFEALASVYGPTLNLRAAMRSRFATAVRLGDARDQVSDDIARATAKEQLAIAIEKGEAAAKRGTPTAAVSLRLKTADRLSKAASAELDKGAYQAALELSGAAAQAATEAQLFATFAANSSTTASTTVTSSVSAGATTSVERGQDQRPQSPATTILRSLFD